MVSMYVQFGRQLSDATISSWRFLSSAALHAAEATQKIAAEVLGDDDVPRNPENSEPTVVDADDATNSKPMTV